jgi:hypothetical protein
METLENVKCYVTIDRVVCMEFLNGIKRNNHGVKGKQPWNNLGSLSGTCEIVVDILLRFVSYID